MLHIASSVASRSNSLAGTLDVSSMPVLSGGIRDTKTSAHHLQNWTCAPGSIE